MAATRRALGLLCWVVSGGVLLAIAVFVGSEGAEPPTVDRAVLMFVTTQRGALLDGFFSVVTWAGSLALLVPLIAAISVALVSSGHVKEAWLLGLGTFGASLITHLGKLFFARLRPAAIDPIVALPSDYSFPSAHSTQISAFVIALLLVGRRVGWGSRIGMGWLWLVGIALIAIVGFSRIYLQVHYPSDVLAGILHGGFWSLGLHLLESDHRPGR